jgi:hypothetical protein
MLAAESRIGRLRAERDSSPFNSRLARANARALLPLSARRLVPQPRRKGRAP